MLVSLLAVSAVNAAENATNDIIKETTGEVVLVEENSTTKVDFNLLNQNDYELDDSIINFNVQKLNTLYNENYVQDNANVKTFGELASKINSGKSEIVLDCDYRYNATVDSDYQSGVTISNSIVIDGNGHVIDGNGEAKLLVVSSNGVTLKNIVFTNIFSSSTQTDGAVKWTGKNGFLTNCSFTNISVKYGTAALSMSYTTLTSAQYMEINSCSFINNSVRTDGNIVTLGRYVQLSNCIFINNTASGVIKGTLYSNDPKLRNCEFIRNVVDNRGIIYSQYHTIELDNCSFVNNSATSAGIVYAEDDKNSLINCSFMGNNVSSGETIVLIGDECNVIDCSFINNRAANGGAIYLKGNEGTLANCSFANNFVTSYGGSVYWNGLDGVITNCVFKDNFASNGGGAIYWLGDYGTLVNCSFIKNSVSTLEHEGGAVRWNGKNGKIFDCSFINNSAYGGSAISIYGDNGIINNCLFVENYGYGAAGAIYFGAMNCILNNSYFENNSASYAGAIMISKINITLENCSFVNNSANDGGAIIVKSDNNYFMNCLFRDNNALDLGGAIYLMNNNCILYNCSFIQNSADYGGGILIQRDNNVLNNISFTNNSAATWGGAIYWMGLEGILSNSSFARNSANNGGAIFWRGDDGIVSNSSFIDNCAYENGSSIYWYGNHGNLINCIVVDNFNLNQVYWWNRENGNIENCKFINNTNGVINRGAKFSRNNISLNYYNASFDFKNPKNISVALVNVLKDFPIKSTIIFNFVNDNSAVTFNSNLSNNFASVCDELVDLNAGTWNVTAIFMGDDNYAPNNTTFTVTINPIDSSLTIVVNDTVVYKETVIVATVYDKFNLTINDGSVIFFDGEINIGEANVCDGVATLTYIPATAGEHTISAIFNSTNYLSSKDAARLLVDSVDVEVIVENITYGYNSTITVNVKGLYSEIDDGHVSFYVDDEFIGSASVVGGYARLIYAPKVVGNYIVKAVYESDKFLKTENTTFLTVNKAESSIFIDGESSCTIGDALPVTAIVKDSNGLINEGIVTFYDGNEDIGSVHVKNGIALMYYVPSTAGKHRISAIYEGSNYLSSNSSHEVIVYKAYSQINVNNVSAVSYGSPLHFIIDVTSNQKKIQEGNVKFYVNDNEVASQSVNDGKVILDYISPVAGTFDVDVIFEETSEYLSSNVSVTVTVNKLSAKIFSNNVNTVYNGGKYIVSTLKDSLGNPISGLEVLINLNGKSSKLFAYKNGQVKLSTNGLAPKSYVAKITFKGDAKYAPASKSIKVIVKKATPKLTAKSKTFKKSVKIKKYTVTMKTNQNKVMKNTKLTLKVNGKTYYAKTNAKGQATFKINKLTKKGKHAATIKYSGSKYYNSKTVKVNIIVK